MVGYIVDRWRTGSGSQKVATFREAQKNLQSFRRARYVNVRDKNVVIVTFTKKTVFQIFCKSIGPFVEISAKV